jgi:menaquinone-dependent protoporphyrinogen IX oxidase
MDGQSAKPGHENAAMENPRVLIVYYSRSGTTRKVAEALSAALHCDTEEIVETRSRSGPLGYVRSLLEARRRRPSATVARANKDPSRYDLIIVGTPVWAWSVSPPVRAYMMANRTRFAAVAFFCTLGASGSDSTFAQMKELAGKAPRGCLFLTAREVASRRHEAKLMAFVKVIAGPAADTGHANAANTSSTAFS